MAVGSHGYQPRISGMWAKFWVWAKKEGGSGQKKKGGPSLGKERDCLGQERGGSGQTWPPLGWAKQVVRRRVQGVQCRRGAVEDVARLEGTGGDAGRGGLGGGWAGRAGRGA